jgi:MT-A70
MSNYSFNSLLQLPYGTMTDDEMKAMPIPTLQDEGLLFLWVTGRAMEIGRECLRVWGYTRVDEVVWVKTNQVHIHSLSHLTDQLISFPAPTCNSHGSYWPLVKSHKGTHVSRRQNAY